MAELHGGVPLFGAELLHGRVPLFGNDPLSLPRAGVCSSRFNVSLLVCCHCLQHNLMTCDHRDIFPG